MSDSHRTPAVAGRRVLVVDDNEDAAESLAALLRLFGHEVHVALDGEQALEIASTMHPQVVLLDLGMPRMDGYELAQRVRQHPQGRHVTLAALTGWGHERDRQRSREVGIDHHLVNPVDLEVLRQLLASLPDAAERVRRA
jgi:CheY-like chemotaxis protein